MMIWIREKRSAINTSLYKYGITKELRRHAVVPLQISAEHEGLQGAIAEGLIDIVEPIFSPAGIRTGFLPINEVT